MDDNESLSPTGSHGDDDDGTAHPRKRQRVRLSCLECRRRKLSCDRGYPCQRCLKSGTPDRCSYETKSGAVLNASAGVPLAFAQLDSRRSGDLGMSSRDSDASSIREAVKDHDRIRKLELEVAQLKTQLARQAVLSIDGSTVAATNSPLTQKDDAAGDLHPHPTPAAENPQLPAYEDYNESLVKGELRFFRGKEFRTRYFGPHNANMAFLELTGLCPFMKETAAEWLKPTVVTDRKDRQKRKEDREQFFGQADAHLESLLPPKDELDGLVDVYLDQFEQIHRIVHIPTFRREYAQYWSGQLDTRYAAFTALLLAIAASASCVRNPESPRFVGMVSSSHKAADRWIKEVEDWHGRQSMKHRRLVHYQIACLLYLAKRVNTIKKKRFWNTSGSLTRDSITVGLHREPSHLSGKISPYNAEMRRRIWATAQEFDMQASFDQGLPTIISQLHYDVLPPRNIDDDDFDENSTSLPPSRPLKEYTFSSYQNLARQSLPLRLELSQLLCGPPGDLDYDQVIRYTNDITQEIDALPSWENSPDNTKAGKRPLLAYTLLHIQLRQYIIPLHQPYLKLRKSNPKYQYSEVIYYNAARDIVLLHDKLFEQGVRSLNTMREDALTSLINLCSVTMLQPRGSTNMIMINSAHTVKLLEKCLAMKEDRLLRCGNTEPWGYSIMCSALGLLEAHLGTKTAEQAKASSAERFLNLHCKLVAGQEPPGPTQLQTPMKSGAAAMDVPERPKSVTPFSFPPFPSSQQSDNSLNRAPTPLPWIPSVIDPEAQAFNPDFGYEMLGLNLNELWTQSWEEMQ